MFLTRVVAGFLMLLMLSSCVFKPMYGDGNDSGFGDSFVKIDYIGERDGQIMRRYLEERLSMHQSRAPKYYYLVKLELDFSVDLQIDNYLNDSPRRWDVIYTVNMQILDEQNIRLRPVTDLERTLGVEDSVEGKQILFRKAFYERGSVFTGLNPSAFELAKGQLKEQILEQLSASIYREIVWFMRDSRAKQALDG